MVGEGALSAVAGSMCVGYMPGEPNSEVYGQQGMTMESEASDRPRPRDATPKKCLPSILEDAEDVVFGPGTRVMKGALNAIAGDMAIAACSSGTEGEVDNSEIERL